MIVLPLCSRPAFQTLICDAQLGNPPKLPGFVWEWALLGSWRKLWRSYGEAKEPLPECQRPQSGVPGVTIPLLRLPDQSWHSDHELKCQRNISRSKGILPTIPKPHFDLTALTLSAGGILSLCGSRGLLESNEGVYAVILGPQHPRAAICLCCQAWRPFCTGRLRWHHDTVPGVVQQTA